MSVRTRTGRRRGQIVWAAVGFACALLTTGTGCSNSAAGEGPKVMTKKYPGGGAKGTAPRRAEKSDTAP